MELGGAPVNLSELEQELPVGGKGSGSTEALNIVGALERTWAPNRSTKYRPKPLRSKSIQGEDDDAEERERGVYA